MTESASNASSCYRHPQYLQATLQNVVGFYHPRCLDTVNGGYIAQLDEQEGYIYDGGSKHLVATTRSIHNFSLVAKLNQATYCRTAAQHGLQFLDSAHYDETSDGYDWILSGRQTEDATRYCYGHAFVLLAYARAVEIGLASADTVHRIVELLTERFFDPDVGLFAAEATPDWDLTSYRGQNANMHACEAFIAAYEATGVDEYLDRAIGIADSLTRTLARDSDGLIWEHYTQNWNPDFEYNQDHPRDTFRPWGYQPGHQAEWAKLLCLLSRHRETDWCIDRAKELFDEAVRIGWDDEYGGFYYTVTPEGEPMVTDKYSWPIAEAIGAAALLGQHDTMYWEWYDRFWSYANEYFINPRFGNWYESLTRDHERDGPNHGIAVEPGYHPITNTVIALSVFGD